jgi:hypothetical protein
MVGMQIDTSELRDAMRLYARATKKDEVSVVNRTARNFAIKVIPRTPKAAPEKIEGELKALPRETFLGLVFSKMRRSTKQGRSLKGVFTAHTRQGSRQAMALAMTKFIQQRKATGGYIRRGWYNIARAFGAAYAVSMDRVKGGKAVRKSYAKKASQSQSLIAAEFENVAKGAGLVGWQATEQALAATISDMTDYAYREMQRTADKFSARKGRK